MQGMLETLQVLANVPRLVVLSQIPDLNSFSAWQRFAGAEIDATRVVQWHEDETRFLEDLAQTSAVGIVQLRPAFCSMDVCDISRDGRRLFTDDNHLSSHGATRAWSYILAELGETP